MAKRSTKTAKMGRPPVEYSADVIPILDAYEGSGTLTELMKLLGVKHHVFYKWMKEEPDFSAAVKRVRDRADDQVEAGLWSRAKGYTVDVREERLSKDGDVVDTRKEIHVQPDPGAAMNWLKNRRPDDWRDKKEVEVTGDHVELVERALRGELGDE